MTLCQSSGTLARTMGAGTRTLFGKAEIVLIRTDETAYRLECWRSYATYVQGFLAEAAREFGQAASGAGN